MCGIFGYVGPRARPHLLIESLARLEYRGYDSWGIALAGKNGLELTRRPGRIGGARCEDDPAHDGRWWGGIAHTRWATHGAPTEANAHPHLDCSGRFAIVHNGIIENYSSLRRRLQQQGHRFRSETDSEVVAHLIEELRPGARDFRAAFLQALRLLEGTYGLAAVSLEEPDMLLAARHGSPMVIGLGEGEMLLASDAAALAAHTRRVVYLDDGEAAALRPAGFETWGLNSAAPVNKTVQQIAFDLPQIERGGYAHFMLKEIHEQPEAIRNALRGRIVHTEGTAKLGGLDEKMLRDVRRCHILACGTSWHAGLIGKYLLENLARIPTDVSQAAEFRYANPVVESGTLAIAVSQSGETADTLAAAREAARRGAATMGICNVVGSTIARECGQGMYIHAGPEIGVASTKAFTAQLAVLTLLAVHMARMRGMSLQEGTRFLEALERIPEQTEQALALDERVREVAAKYAAATNFLYVGRLYEYPVALEGALKLKEISYIHAEGIPAAELKHGPIALIDETVPTVVLATQSGILPKMLSNIQEIKARSGRILAITRAGASEVERLADDVLHIPDTLDPLTPLLAVIPLQLLAYHIAVHRGCDVDKPRNLAKSVTVE